MNTDKRAVPEQRLSQKTEPGDAKPTLDADRVRRLMGVIAVSVIVETSVIVLYVIIYFLTGALQMLGMAGLAVLGLACAGLSYWLVRRGHLDAAGYSLLLTILIAYGGSDWFLTGETVYLVVGSVMLVLFVGSIILPRRWEVWLITLGLILVSIWLANQLVPASDRYDVAQIALLNFTMPGLAILVALAFLGQAIRTFRIGNIRTRLLVTFVLMALVPAFVISGVATAGSVLTGRERILSQLETISSLKESEIGSWVQDLQESLDNALVEQQRLSIARVLDPESVDPDRYRLAYNDVSERFRQVIERSQRFEELFLMDTQGRVVLSTDPTQEGKDLSEKVYVREGLEKSYVTPPAYSPVLIRFTIVVVQPVESQGQVIGILAGRTSMDALNAIVAKESGLGDTGEIYLVGANHLLLTTTRSREPDIEIHTFGVDQVIGARSAGNGADLYENYQREPVVGAYRWLPQLQVALLVEQTQTEAFGTIYLTTELNIGVALAAGLIAGLLSLYVTRYIANPLIALAETATGIAAGELEQTAVMERQDEIGTLAQAFNSMTTQLRGLIGSLEQRVADRTRDLEQRSAVLEAAADVSSAATSILEAERLIAQVVELIHDRFDLYYVGLFLIDEAGEWAVLRAGTGQAGQALLARNHRIRIGQGLIGWSIANGQTRVAAHAEEDDARLVIADLPDTRSEVALPLRSRGQVLGAISVQHTQPDAFDQDTLVVLQTMADQIAVALDNAYLFAQSQEALDTTRRAYGDMARQSWSDLLRTREDLGYRSAARGLTQVGRTRRPEIAQVLHTGQIAQAPLLSSDGGRQILVIPIKVRGDVVIGVLDTYKLVNEGPWTQHEITMLEAIADQLGATLESAQLFEDTQRRARDEQQLRTITAQVRDAPDLDAVLQTAVQEMARALGVERVFVQLGTPPPLEPQIEK